MKQKRVMTPAADGSIYIPMDGPWQSDEDNAAYAEAERIFNEYRQQYPYVALIESHNWASQGYWVEIKENKLHCQDRILKLHKAK
jgi:hypothetical protein